LQKKNVKTIAENEYNLNVPRYVETFEASAKIDIDLISKELKEKALKRLRNKTYTNRPPALLARSPGWFVCP
jgi:type I restriction-modification system DNA methylase subunit